VSTTRPRGFGSTDPGKLFYGRWIVATAVFTFGISVGVPYYNLPFFYDYFQNAHHWGLEQITLGFPLVAVLTLWVGPLLIPRFTPRSLILCGTGLTAISLFGFSAMNGSVHVYYLLCFVYMVGYIFSGPIPHQILISYWFQKKRGRAMGILYAGPGLFGGLGSFFVRALTDKYAFQTALMAVGALMFLTWPFCIFILKDNPSVVGQYPDGGDRPSDDAKLSPHGFSHLLRSGSFWLLLLGSICSIGAIGSINVHMKFVFRDAGFTNQAALNAAWTHASALILWSSIAGRLSIGYFADVFSKKSVMTATYFMVAATILLLLHVSPKYPASLDIFAVGFGFSMGADYMLIPLMAAERFGINTLARAMSIILPVNTIGQTWCPYLVSALREHYGNYRDAMAAIVGMAIVGAVAIAVLPRRSPLLETALSLPGEERRTPETAEVSSAESQSNE
jgi:MFS family permease